MSKERRVAIITGGASGIGFAFAQGLAETGYAVVIADVRRSAEAAAQLTDAGHSAIGVTVDVTSVEDTEAMAKQAVDAFGRLDVLINNAGILDRFLPAAETPDELWDRAASPSAPAELTRASPGRRAERAGIRHLEPRPHGHASPGEPGRDGQHRTLLCFGRGELPQRGCDRSGRRLDRTLG